MTAYATDGGYRPAPPTADEQAKVQQVMEILAGMSGEEQALNVLRKNAGDVQKTISALLDDPSSGSAPIPSASNYAPPPPINEPLQGFRSRSPPPSRPEKPHMIDLTGDDEDNDVQMALRASIEQIQPALQRNEEPTQVEVPGDGMTQDDQQMSQAIEASLNDGLALEQFEEKPLAERLRQGESPVVLRSTSSAFTYAALILQALYYVPQIREAIARGYAPELQEDIMDESGMPTSSPDNATFTVLETFVYLELSRMADLDADTALKAFETDPWPKHIESPGDISWEFYGKVSWAVETVLNRHQATDPAVDNWPRLFHFRHGPSGEPPVKGPFDRNLDSSIVRVPIPGTLEANDLISCLRLEFRDDVIVSPSEVVAFHLARLHHTGGERQRFSYPSSIYLDQFMHEKASLANEKRRLQHELLAEIDGLREKKRALTKDKHGDALANLKSALYYYDNIAEDEGDDMRRSNLEDTVQILRKIVASVETQLKGFESEIEAKKAEAERIMDCPELQENKFDLRAVLVHDGYYGRNHLYSYVKDRTKWWKLLEHTTSEVTEDDVLTDPIGLHLRAGPYLLIYGRSVSLEEEARRPPWPERLKDSVKECNITLFQQLSSEITADVVDPNSPPTTAFTLPPDPMSETSSLAVEPPSRADSMDVDR